MNTYEVVTARITSLLEQGVVPWKQPWSAIGTPRNLITKKPYRGVNFFLLSATEYLSPSWLTFRQANELGGSVRKGEHGQQVVFWRVYQPLENSSDPDTMVCEETDQSRRRFVLRLYRVFNLEQCELPQAVLNKIPKIEAHQHNPIEECEQVIANMPNPPTIEYGGVKAFYSPIRDRITLPTHHHFMSAQAHFETWAHEASHATGHPKWLNRYPLAQAAAFGSPAYAAEELVAELSAAYLCAEAGISPAVIDNEAAYIQGWLGHLRADLRMIVKASAHAQRAADYIMGRRTEKL